MHWRKADRELDAELESYLELLVEEKVRVGLSPSDARRAALLELGGMTQVAEAVRDERPGAWIGQLGRDLRYALRVLRRAPAFTLVAVLSLALGLGANTTIFSVIEAVFLRTLPVPNPEQLIVVGKPTAIDGHTTGAPRSDLFSVPLYHALQDDREIVDGFAATGTPGRLDVRADSAGEIEHPAGRLVSGNYFTVFEVGAARGRLLTPNDDRTDSGSPVAVISESYWRRRFNAASDIVGRAIDVDGARLTIVGVAAPGFTGEILERPTDLWMPIAIQPLLAPHSAPIDDWGTSWLVLIGRLRPGVRLEQARASLTTLVRQTIIAHLGDDSRPRYADASVPVTSGLRGRSAIRSVYAPPLRILALGVLLLLLIVCTNVANLLLARAVTRRREITVRLALGAGRRQLLRQLLAECLVLGALGCIPGILLAWWGSHALVTAASVGETPIATPRMDLAVLGYCIGLTIVAVLLFGLVPALRASALDVATGLRARGGALSQKSDSGRIPIGRLLVPLQVSLSLVLLVGASLLVHSVVNLQSSDPGLDRDHLLEVEVDATRRDYRGQSLFNLAHELRRALSATPGVRAVSYSQNGLFAGRDGTALVSIPGFVGRTSDDSSLYYDLVGPGYVQAIGGRLLRGRDIDESDRHGAPSVAVVNQALAKFYFGTVDAVGKTIYFDAGVPTTVVGVVADVKDHTLMAAPPRRAYGVYDQQIGDDEHASLNFTIRAEGDPAMLVRRVRATIAEADRSLPIVSLEPVAVLMRESIHEQRLVAAIATGFGIVALLLATLGLYGVMSYAVGRRTGEMGLRSALGAARGRLIGLVLSDGLRLVAGGVALGVPAALAAARLLRGELVDVPAVDPFSLIIALVALASTAFVAALVPALRASRVDPVIALNQE